MTQTLEQIRERAAEHERELSEWRYLSVKEVASIIHLSETFVRGIPRDELPFTEFGHGHQLKRRRYRRADVDEYFDTLYQKQNAGAR